MANHGEAIDRNAFERLLSALDSDRTRAGQRYVVLRHKLVKFFEWRDVPHPEDAADATLDVLSRRLLEGEPVQNVAAYAYGVARMILLTQRRDEELRREVHAQAALASAPDAGDADRERRLACLDQSLERMPLANRTLILGYYTGERRTMMRARKALAAKLGIALNPLRIRAHRLRLKLEEDVRRCLAGESR